MIVIAGRGTVVCPEAVITSGGPQVIVIAGQGTAVGTVGRPETVITGWCTPVIVVTGPATVVGRWSVPNQ